jgi:hypothetical protein
MFDLAFLALLAALAALTWGLIALCDGVKGGGP